MNHAVSANLKAVLLAAAVAATAAAQSGTLAPSADSSFVLEVEKTGIFAGKKHIFVFDKFSGTFSPEKVEFRVDSRAITVKDDWSPASGARDKILEVAQKEMLEAARYPELIFVSNAISQPSTGVFEVKGQLTIKNVTRPVTVQAKQDGDFYGGTAIVKHTDFGLKQQKAALGAIGTKDEMLVRFRLRPSAKTP